MDDAAWKRVAERVRTRRDDELGLTQEQLAVRAEVGSATIRLIETANRTRYNRSTLRQVSLALGWTSDGINQILEGHEPTEAEPTPRAATDAEVAALRQEVETLKTKFERLERERQS